MTRSAHRTRHREAQTEVGYMASELAAIIRVLPYAVPRDQAEKPQGIRRPKPRSMTPSALTNGRVLRAVTELSIGLWDIASDCRPGVGERHLMDSPLGILGGLPDWHERLVTTDVERAASVESRLSMLLTMARSAARLQQPDEQFGYLCPDHRDTRPAALLLRGVLLRLEPSLLAGPPARGTTTCDPATGRLYVAGEPTDWIIVHGEERWQSLTGRVPWTAASRRDIWCPHCDRRWATLTEKRLLMAELAGLGDRITITTQAS